MDTSAGPPPLCPAHMTVTFAEVKAGDDSGITELATAMGPDSRDVIRERLQHGRRCFVLRTTVAGEGAAIVAYGWVTQGPEDVGELERQFHFYPDEAYIWDCATLPAWRRQGCYSSLLSQIARCLQAEGISHIWIGASRQNRPSIQGFTNAGFRPVVDVTYHRIYRLTLFWIHPIPTAQRPLLADAYRILINKHERLLGQLAVGILSSQKSIVKRQLAVDGKQ